MAKCKALTGSTAKGLNRPKYKDAAGGNALHRLQLSCNNCNRNSRIAKVIVI